MKGILGFVATVALLGQVAFADTVTWDKWGVHEGEITAASAPSSSTNLDGTVTTTVGTVSATAGTNADYHWNKNSSGQPWSGRTGEKAFLSTSYFNGMKVSDILAINYTVTGGYYGNVYFNLVVQDASGDIAILAPRTNNGTISAFGAAFTYNVNEADAGFDYVTGTTGLSWDIVKDLTIASGVGMTHADEPDNLAGDAEAYGSSVYSAANWAAWGGSYAASDSLLIVFGQSIGTTEALKATTLTNLSITYNERAEEVPEPATMALLALGLAAAGLRRKKS